MNTTSAVRGLLVIVLVVGLGAALFSGGKPKQALTLQPGEHICILGNTLADRMQHDGWLETYFHARFPQHDLTFRNLGFSGDELTLRLRSQDFGTPDQWLTRCQADVVFAFFGYNESFAGREGLEKFKKDLAAFIKHTREQKYNGKSAPRLVLFSPSAHEDLKDRRLPDGRENNARLKFYAAAMAEVAAAHEVAYVDLFHSMEEAYAREAKPLTINGVHLNELGNEKLGQIVDRTLFGDAPPRDRNLLKRIRQVVADKNFLWFNRYRTVDGYSIYGGRADLKFVEGQTNRVVMQREMEVLDVMTANRDQRIWAIARGGDKQIDDANAPPFIPVVTNKPGAGPGGKHLFLDGDEAIKSMTIAKGLKVNLFASEKQFPELANPVQMAWDTRGRLWVATWTTYPHWKPRELMDDRLLVFEDTNSDGKADKVTVFADGLHCPTGFEFYDDGVLVAMAPDLIFLKDTDGDGTADVRTRVLSGLCSADTHHTANSFVLDPTGALYFQEGTFHHTQVETPWGPPVRCANAGIFRYEPRAHKFDTYISFGFANPHGHVFDRWGQDIVVDGTGSNPYHAALFSGHLDFPHKHQRPPQVYQQRTRPCPGMEYLSSKHFPESMQGDLLVANVIGFQGILRYKLHDQGASYGATEMEPMLSSTDPSFRPSDLKIGPDGAVYFLDWHNPIIGHMQHNLRDPSRDRTHGRIYRVTHEGRSLSEPARIAGEPVAKLLDLLKSSEDRVRYRARIELGARPGSAVLPTLEKWLGGLDKSDADYEHHLLEALWLHRQSENLDRTLLDRVLSSPDFRARAAAARVVCYWRDRLPDALELFKKLAADPHPRVRLEAIRAASFFRQPEAIEIPLIASELPTDQYLEFVKGETLRALDPHVKKAIAEGRQIAFTTPAGARYFLKHVSTDDLLRMKRTQGVFLELLVRKGVRDEFRREALAGLAKLENKPEVRILLDAIQGGLQEPQRTEPADDSVLFDLVRLLTSRSAVELAGVRPDLLKQATSAPTPLQRELGFVALIAADGGVDEAWTLGVRSVRSLQDLVNAMPLIRDPVQRASLYPKVAPLLDGLPKPLADAAARSPATLGRFVRIELSGKQRTLTLAEVEVYSDGKNVARQGKASQKTTSHGGDAKRGIDGNKSGTYADAGQTHTQEGQADPWWEVDLGGDYPIDRIEIWNRTDGNLGTRLKDFALKVLDRERRVVFQKQDLPTPETKAVLAVSGEAPERLLRRSAMLALTTVRGQETAAFNTLARFVKRPHDRVSAIQALLRIPVAHWPQEEARPLLTVLLAHVRQIPVADRTSPTALEALQLADSLVALLPRAEARQMRQELGELGVRVIRLGAVPDQMLFDKERLVVRAGRPVEVIFENNDLMPHNFVITQPGALEEIGTLAEASATQPGAAERQYVPSSAKVIVASRLLQPREMQQLRFTAPTRPGVYPFVCTYPGHWRRMFGALYVVEDLDEYLADAEGYLTQHPLPIADELLKNVRARKEWKLDDLTPALAELKTGRSFSNGKQMFQVANCLACHKLGGAGVEIGPDLTKLDPKWRAPEILQEILDPSKQINEKYQTWTFETQAGRLITGLVIEETTDAVKVVENPLVKADPLVLRKADIADRKKSPNSVMPKGLLDKLTREEILDLLAYVTARGEAGHRYFQAGAGHHHGKH